MSQEHIPGWITNRILGFFNQARNVDDILNGRIQDDPADGPGRTMSRSLAAKILRTRQEQPYRRFTEFAQIDAVKGVGPGTIQDLVYSFGSTAAQSFLDKMYDEHVIYQENWPLMYFQYSFDDIELFRNTTQDEGELKTFLQARILELAQEHNVSTEDCDQMVQDVEVGFIDRYSNSTPAAAYAFALWFYEFDADNWFSWERIQEQTLAYFDHHMQGNPWEMELVFVKGFQQRGIIDGGFAPDDLPVVINWPEQCVSMWMSALRD